MSQGAESVPVRLARALAPVAAHPQFARTIEAGIAAESAWRRVTDLQLRSVGVRTGAMRRRRKELAESPAGLATQRGHAPCVNWHEGGSGPVLLLLNGWSASGLVWPTAWVRQLETRFRVIRVDNRGTGWSRSAPAPYRVADLADDAYDVLRTCEVERATVLGLSMGGMIAQELALRHPGAVDHLLLVGTAPPVPAQLAPDPTPFLAALKKPGRDTDLDELFRHTWSSYTADPFATEQPEVIDEIVAQIRFRLTPRRCVLDQLRAIRSWHGPTRLARITAPTTVVHGRRDPLIPVGNGMRLSRLIPAAHYVELPEVGHLVAHEAGARLLDCVPGAG